MHTTLTTKGQLVVPKAIRDALHIKPGMRLTVTLENDRIVLQPVAQLKKSAADWQPVNPKGKRLSSAELNQPVTLDD